MFGTENKPWTEEMQHWHWPNEKFYELSWIKVHWNVFFSLDSDVFFSDFLYFCSLYAVTASNCFFRCQSLPSLSHVNIYYGSLDIVRKMMHTFSCIFLQCSHVFNPWISALTGGLGLEKGHIVDFSFKSMLLLANCILQLSNAKVRSLLIAKKCCFGLYLTVSVVV